MVPWFAGRITSVFTATVDPAPMVAIGALSGKSALWPPKRSEEPNTSAATAANTDRWRRERIPVNPFRYNKQRFGVNSSTLPLPEKQNSALSESHPRYQVVAQRLKARQIYSRICSLVPSP